MNDNYPELVIRSDHPMNRGEVEITLGGHDITGWLTGLTLEMSGGGKELNKVILEMIPGMVRVNMPAAMEVVAELARTGAIEIEMPGDETEGGGEAPE